MSNNAAPLDAETRKRCCRGNRNCRAQRSTQIPKSRRASAHPLLAPVPVQETRSLPPLRRHTRSCAWRSLPQPTGTPGRERRETRRSSLRLTCLPVAELLEQRTLFLNRQRRLAIGLPALVEKTRKHQPHLVDARRFGDLHVFLQPLFGWRIAPPARQIGGKIHIVPFLMVAGFQKRWEAGKERLDKIRDVAVSLGNLTEFGDREHGSDGDRFDRLVGGYQYGIIGGRESGRHIDIVARLIERNVQQAE